MFVFLFFVWSFNVVNNYAFFFPQRNSTADDYVMRFSWQLMASAKKSFHISHASITKQLIPACFVFRLFALTLSSNYSLFV